MRTSFISTLSLAMPMRNNLSRMQSDLSRLSGEIASGRMADAGLTLGTGVASSVTFRSSDSSLSALIDGNGQIKTRLSQSQSALDTLRAGADSFLKTLLNSNGQGDILQAAGATGLDDFIATMNASDGQRYLFGGINSGTAPIANYDAGAGAAVDAAFLAKFGVSQSDPAAAQITGADMADFLDNEFSALFADPAWSGTWSSASDQPQQSRISTTRTIDTSASANEAGFRKLAMAYTMVAKLGTAGLGEGARKAIIDKATSLIGTATTDVVDIQSRLGSAENAVDDATKYMTSQRDIVATQLDKLEGVDPVEAKTRLDTLNTQIEMSYSLTNRLLRLSILNYS
jgi:flagellar hook-associated protein 3 FlgL